MKTTTQIYLIFLASITCATLSCKKKGNNAPSNSNSYNSPLNNLKLKHVNYVYSSPGGISDPLDIWFFYNADSTIDSIVNYQMTMGPPPTNDSVITVTKFTYFKSYYLIESQGVTITVNTDSSGLITKISNANGNFFYFYKGNELSQAGPDSQLNANGNYFYLWENGNPIRTTQIGSSGQLPDTIAIAYDNSHYGQPGDAIQIGDVFSYGRSILKTYNVALSENGATSLFGNANFTYSYQFDIYGRIIIYHWSSPYGYGDNQGGNYTYEYY